MSTRSADELRPQALEANLDLSVRAPAHASFGNVSAVDREADVVVTRVNCSWVRRDADSRDVLG